MLIEAMTYRVGHHSTSDDSLGYREQAEISYWIKNDNPITRLRLYLEKRQWWDKTQDDDLKKNIRKRVGILTQCYSYLTSLSLSLSLSLSFCGIKK